MSKESYLSEGLKTISRKREKATIKLCGCGAPLIWTFFIPYCEWFCLNCGNAGGMFGTGENKPLTRERKLHAKLVNATFKILRKHILPGGKFGRSKCKKDDAPGRYSSSCDDHRKHLTRYEIEMDALARRWLKHFQGKFRAPKLPTKSQNK